MHSRTHCAARRWFGYWLAVPVALVAMLSVALGGEDEIKDAPAARPAAKTKSGLSQALLKLLTPEEGVPAVEKAAPASSDTSYRQVGKIKVGKGATALQTFCITADGQLVAIVGPPRNYGATAARSSRAPAGRIEIFEADGASVRGWDIEFAPQSVAVGPDGEIYVGGHGKLARYNIEGEQQQLVDSPHLAIALKDEDGLKEAAEEQLKQQQAAYDEQIEQLTEQLKDLEERIEGDDQPSAAVKRSIARVKSQLKAYEQAKKQIGAQNVDAVIAQTTARLRNVTAMAVAEKDVFIATGVLQGYGFSVWRMGRDLTEPTQIVTGLSGCCGQMDIQCCGDKLYAAENSRHRVVCFDRDGKRLSSFGSSNRTGTGEGFGGCCNPMNLRFATDGSIYTAESEGLIKKFTPEGKFVELAGKATLSGGCKNVAVAASADGARLYFLDLPGSQIIMLERKTSDEKPAEKVAEDKEKKVSARQK